MAQAVASQHPSHRAGEDLRRGALGGLGFLEREPRGLHDRLALAVYADRDLEFGLFGASSG